MPRRYACLATAAVRDVTLAIVPPTLARTASRHALPARLRAWLGTVGRSPLPSIIGERQAHLTCVLPGPLGWTSAACRDRSRRLLPEGKEK